jgi:outer membrane protein assembly factor BamB
LNRRIPGVCAVVVSVAVACEPPAAPPVAPTARVGGPPPLANLDVAARFDAPTTATAINHGTATLAGERFVVVRRQPSWVVATYEAATGSGVAQFIVEPMAEHLFEGGLQAAGDMLVGVAGGELLAYGTDGAVRWRRRVDDDTTLAPAQSGKSPHDVLYAAAVLQRGATLFVLAAEQHQEGPNVPGAIEIFALDAATGALRWRRPVGRRLDAGWDNDHLGLAGATLVAMATPGLGTGPTQMFGLDTATGSLTWERTLDDAPGRNATMLADGRDVVVTLPERQPSQGARWSILDPATGADAAVASFDASTVGATMKDGVVYEILSEPAAIAVAARRAHGGAPLWRSAPIAHFADAAAGGGRIVAAADAVYTCTGDGVVRAFDGRTGALAWSWGLGACELVGVTEGGAVAVVGTDGAMTFVRKDRPAPTTHARVEGTVLVECQPSAGETVLLGDTSATTDDRGRFAADVSWRGVLDVETAPLVPVKRKGAPGTVATRARTTIAPNARGGPYTAELSVHPWEFCGYGACEPLQAPCKK